MKSLSKHAIGLLGLLFLLASCQAANESSLLSDQKDDSSAYDVDRTPKSEELFLKLDSSTISAQSTDTKVEISGECYVSTYPSHKIIVLDEGGSQINSNVLDVNPATPNTANYATCRNGKFSLLLRIYGWTSPSVYNLKVRLQAWDSAGSLVLNQAQAEPALTLTK